MERTDMQNSGAMTHEQIETVARALWDQHETRQIFWFVQTPWDDLHPETRAQVRSEVRAILDALASMGVLAPSEATP